MHARQIRQTFLDFFAARGHQIVPSAPLVIQGDPTLLFTNSGMNQFKEYFLGTRQPKTPRIADTQKCLRVSGKHNDLEDVGLDTYHHTMFEMLGNWSFGDYFKQEAIAWSWELLTKEYGLPEDRLYATVFGGDETEGLPPDDEARQLWRQYLPDDRILAGSKKDNFWEMGDTGPCGPCTEIHIDLRSDAERAHVAGAHLVNADNPRVVELWNNVFMEFNRLASGSLEPLPSRHVDTGMGFERLCMALQGKTSNYDTDVFTPLIDKIASLSGKTYGQDEKTDIAFRVIADHIRAVAFAITDGQLPSNVKAGYVIRRILRRAVRYGYSYLGLREPFMHTLVPVLAAQFEGVFPEIVSQEAFVARIIQEEERGFLRTLSQGISRLEGLLTTLPAGVVVDGATAFELYDTYGFPIDLTALIAREQGYGIDREGFEKALGQQRDRSRKTADVRYGDWIDRHANLEPEFVGYDELESPTRIIRYRINETGGRQQVQIVLSRNPFYAQSGGQVGDTGILEAMTGGQPISIPIVDTLKENGQSVLITHDIEGTLLESVDEWTARVDGPRRRRIEANHSATHLLHAALRRHLGSHVTQRGSMVSDRELRFDFSHPARLTDEELTTIIDEVLTRIEADIPLEEDRHVPYQEAVSRGAMALFGEKYGDSVRVITFDPDFSVELCGGTHVKSTARIGAFELQSEGSVSAGVRRIVATTGRTTLSELAGQKKLVAQIQERLRTKADPLKAIDDLLARVATLEAEAEAQQKERLTQIRERLLGAAQVGQAGKVIITRVDLPADQVKTLSFNLGQAHPDLSILIASLDQGRPQLSVYLGAEALTRQPHTAIDVIKQLSPLIGGGGGGQPFFATAGGKNPQGLEAALEKGRQLLLPS